MSQKLNELSVTLLGPEDSFSDQFLQGLDFGDLKKTYAPSISGIFESLKNNPKSFGIIPLENLLNGQVSATFDGLTRLHSGELKADLKLEIIHSENLLIDLFIGAQPVGECPLSEVEEIFSHEQALAQSEEFIIKNCPNAILTPVDSTSAAVELVKSSKRKVMAIASKIAIKNRGLRVIAKTTPDQVVNKTRFGILSTSESRELILNNLKNINPDSQSTSLCLYPRMDRQGLLLDILSIISEKNKCNLLSIHSRPDQTGGFIFYLELENSRSDNKKVSTCIQDISNYLVNETGGAGNLYNFGTYSKKSFIEQSINSISIIGAGGAMGQWFSDFFVARGMQVHKLEKNSSESEKNLIKNSQVILLSVPMQEVENALNDFLPYISKGSLVVDNSSVKSETLKILLEKVPVDVELASIHTMFGPSEESLKGKNVIFTETGRAGKLAHELERVFYKYGAIITHVSVEEHDKRVAYTQAIVHFISLGFGSFLNSEQVQLDVIKPFLTPNTERLLLNMNRALSQSRELSQGILVDNTFSKSLREVFLKSLAETNAAIDSEELAAQLDLLLKFKP